MKVWVRTSLLLLSAFAATTASTFASLAAFSPLHRHYRAVSHGRPIQTERCSPLPHTSSSLAAALAARNRVNKRHGAPCATALHASSASETSEMISNIRAGLAENDDAALILQALRGTNMNDDDRQVAGLVMRLVDDMDLSDSSNDSRSSGHGLPYVYDPDALKLFFRKRPLTVARRIAQVLAVGGGYGISLLLDAVTKRNRNNPELEVRRAAELRDLITSLGPFFIKLGQALSIRPDILSPRSMVELQKLCDKVPSFDSNIAFATIERELGKSVDELFSSITPEPVAAASLGQVYKATLRTTGETVAVKVQRPGVLETVSLDLYLARELGQMARKFPTLVQRLDAVALLDEFAFRFYQELDYNLECLNGLKIKEQMSVLPDVVIPANFPDYTSRRVHVAEWIEGEKLSQSTADNVGALVNLGVITYLTQLLEFGFFHADPHPGNMMRTTDGKLAILDFGLMTEITDDQKYGMIEAIAHLINRDYTEIGQDFINLDFIPKGTDTRPIVPALTKVFNVALAGGGAKSINFQDLASDLAQITFDFPFRIPPYFALVIRAISVLEGIALVGNPNFAIIDEAYPYIAKRLMTDDSPRLRAALRYMVYGRNDEFDAERVIDLLQALEKFTSVRDEGDGTAFKVDGVRGSRVVGSAGDFVGSRAVDASDRDTDVGGGRFRVAPSAEKARARAGTGAGVVVGSSPKAATTTTLNGNVSGSLAPYSSTTNAANVNNGGSRYNDDDDDDERTVRSALLFFFSDEGRIFREFMLEEIVRVVDASSRDAARELARVLLPPGLRKLNDNGAFVVLPIPSFVRALSPALTEKDKRMVRQIQKLIQFLLGDLDEMISVDNDNVYKESSSSSSSSMVGGRSTTKMGRAEMVGSGRFVGGGNPGLGRIQQRAQRPLSSSGNGGSESLARNERLRKLIPVVREFSPQLREYGSLLLVRLAEKSISRGLNWASLRLA